MTKRQTTVRYMLEGIAALSLTLLLASVIALHLTRPPIHYAREGTGIGITVSARVEDILAERHAVDEEGLITVFQTLRLRILTPGPHQGEVITIDYNGMGPALNAVRFRKGSRALVMISELPQTNAQGQSSPSARTVYQVADHVRLLPLAMVTLLFIATTIAIGHWQGVRALIGLLLSGVLIGAFILPQVLAHRDPVLVTLLSAALLLGAAVYLIQGWNVAGHTSFLGMLVSLAATGILAIIWTQLAYLTGFGSEETLYLQAAGVGLPMRGLLLAGIILGTAGVLDDVIIAQTVAVFELASANRQLSPRLLYHRGMRIGVSHLTSMVNTLVLAYTSTALPLVILFYLYPEPWYLTINRELIAEEIVRTLVGSIGLMLAVPLTTAIAARIAPMFADQPATPEPTPPSGA